jgi:hypothetical protein
MAGSVDDFMAALDHPLKEETARLRAITRAAAPDAGERVKWNAPSYGPGDEDRVTFNLSRRDRVQVIFHRGAKAKTDAAFRFDGDPGGLLTWAAPDRGVAVFRNADEMEAQSAAFAALVRAWLAATA